MNAHSSLAKITRTESTVHRVVYRPLFAMALAVFGVIPGIKAENGKVMKRRAFAGKQGKDFLTKTLRCLHFCGFHGSSALALPQFVFLFLASFFLASNANADLSDGLISHWNYDDCTATDITGNGFNGTLFGNPLCVDGFQGKAFDFDAIDDHIQLNQSLNANSIRSISFWINSRGPDGVNDAGVVLAKYHWFDRRSFLIYSHDGTTSNIKATFYGDGTSTNNDTVVSYYENPELLDPDKYTVINNTKLNNDTWEHVVVNVTDTEIEIWINGQITNKVKRDYLAYFNSGEPTYIGNAFYIGPDFTFDFRLNGKLDDYRIYDRPLTEAEIQELSLRTLSVHPSAGGDTGSVTVQILGDGFRENATVKLVKTGETEIVGSPVNVGPFGRTISTTFDLVGESRGLWDVVLENPNGATFVVSEGFTIEEGRLAEIWVDVIGRSFIRPGRPSTYWITYGNRGNVDAVGVPITLTGIPLDATITPVFELGTVPPEEGEPAITPSDVPLTIQTGGNLNLPLFDPLVPPGAVRSLGVQITVPQGSPEFSLGILKAFTSGGLVPTLDRLLCVTDVIREFLPPGVSCYADTAEQMSLLLGEIIYTENFRDITTYIQILAKLLKECTNVLDGVDKKIEIAINVTDYFTNPPSLFPDSCINLLPPIFSAGVNVMPVTSFDPNDKIGSEGAGEFQYLSGAEPLRYTIFFENIESATAPAQEVVITDQLDAEKMDLSTLALGPIAFGEEQVIPPAGTSNFSTVVDLRPDNDLLVKIEVTLDADTSLLTWRLTALDPDTGELPEDPMAGFLPPNIVPPEGDGSVLFTVMPKAGLPTDTEIINDALIVFDLNPPIVTPLWSNLLDNTDPDSNVLPLAPTQSATDFLVEWTGMDEGAGVSDFTVFVSEDGGPFEVAFADTPETSGAFSGEGGKTYDFYSIARDLTGNLEDAPVTPDASTTVLIDNNPPLANAGPDITVPEQRKKSALVQLDGSNSVDPDEPDDGIVSYLWFEGGLEIASGPSPQIIFERGQHLVSLIVEDTFGLEDSDDLIVTISKKSDDGSGPGPKTCNPNSPKCQSN